MMNHLRRYSKAVFACQPVASRGRFLTFLSITALLVQAIPLLGQTVNPSILRKKMEGPRPPNIIYILADDLGYGDLGSFGQKKIKTPHLDQLAAEGMRFTQAYSGSTVCAPARACLMTGFHTGHTRIRGNGSLPLAPETITVAEVLKKAKYQTGVIGKWGLGEEKTTGTPHQQGYDEWLGYLNQKHAHDYYPTYLWRSSTFNKIYDHVFPLEANFDGQKGKYSHDLFNMAATNYVRISRYRPFFLYLPFTIPHAHNALTRKSGNGMEVPSDTPYSEMPWPQPEKNKAAMITRLDQTVGTLMNYLKKTKLDTNTIVFFSSDNGPHKEGGNDPKFFKSSGGLRGIKRDLYEGGIRVPLIVRWPGRIPAGSVSHEITAAWDFLPTAAELAGVEAPEGLDGISMVPTLLGQTQTNRHEFLYWEFHEKGTKQAVRANEWKAIRLKPESPIELYNLKEDPEEKTNVAEGHPEIVSKMEAYLASARTESDHWPIKNPPSQETKKAAKD